MSDVSLAAKLEALLFFKAEPISKKNLCKQLDITDEALQTAVQQLVERLRTGATRVLETDTEVGLVLAAEHDELIEQLRREEMKRDIGKAGAETLAIVLYRGPVTRGEIDRIRGVNSSYILRNLMVRGLVEKGSNPKRVEYQATADLYRHLGITHKTALPNYEAILNQLDSFEQQVALEQSE